MALSDLVFLFSFLFCAILLIRLVSLTLRRRPWRKTAVVLTGFVTLYAAALIAAALAMPRREMPLGQRKCFDDWCVAVKQLQQSPEGWLATIEVSSVAKGIHQRAADAAIELEDTTGHRYQPAAPIGAHTLRDVLGPGESFEVKAPFSVPAIARPAGLVIHHGAFPGLIIIGADQSWLHPPTLYRIE